MLFWTLCLFFSRVEALADLPRNFSELWEIVCDAETDAGTHVKLIKTTLTFKESDATFILKFAKDFSVGVYRMSVGLFLPLSVLWSKL